MLQRLILAQMPDLHHKSQCKQTIIHTLQPSAMSAHFAAHMHVWSTHIISHMYIYYI